MTISILLNGAPLETTAETLAALTTELGLAGKRYAVEINGALVPKSRHAEYLLQDSLKIEIVHAVGGG